MLLLLLLLLPLLQSNTVHGLLVINLFTLCCYPRATPLWDSITTVHQLPQQRPHFSWCTGHSATQLLLPRTVGYYQV